MHLVFGIRIGRTPRRRIREQASSRRRPKRRHPMHTPTTRRRITALLASAVLGTAGMLAGSASAAHAQDFTAAITIDNGVLSLVASDFNKDRVTVSNFFDFIQVEDTLIK